MKIIGYSYYHEAPELLLKCDSCLLVNRKPFFVPDFTEDVRVNGCVVVRISRLGKNIAPRFASRYYDAFAPGLNFAAYDKLQESSEQGHSWTEATAFDNSLCVGQFRPCEEQDWQWEHNDEKVEMGEWSILVDEAVSRISRVTTIRQGDLVYVDFMNEPLSVQREDRFRVMAGEEEILYCKIK